MNVSDLVQALQMAIKALLMYTDAHPRTQEALQSLSRDVQGLLAEKPSLHIAASGGRLFLDGAPVEGQNLHASALVRQLSERRIAGFVIQRGVSPDELLGMLQLLILKPAKLEEMGGAARVMAERKLQRITLSQTQYMEIREGEGGGSAQDPGASAEALATQLQAAAPLLTDVSAMLKRWQEGLGTGLESAGSGAPGASLPPDLAFLGPVAAGLGWGNGFPTAPQIEALRQALRELPGQTLLAVLGSLGTLPEAPPALGLAFHSLAPELLGQAASSFLLQGGTWSGLEEPLLGLLQAAPQKAAMLASLQAQFQGHGLEPGRLQDLLRQLDWDNQSLDEKVQRAVAEGALWHLSPEQRLSLLRDLLAANRPEPFLQVLELCLERLTSEDAQKREEAARMLADVARWMEDPGLPLEAQGALIQGLVAHFGWEPVPAVQRTTAQGLEGVLACLVNRGELIQAQHMVQEMEGLCAFLDDREEWRGLALAKLRGRLCGEDLMEAAVQQLHAAKPEEMLTGVIPYFEFLGEPAARFLVKVLGEEPDRKRRGRLLDVIRVLGPIALPALQEGLHSPAWYFVRNTLNLLADMGDAGLLDDVAACLGHGDGRVRRSAVRAMWKLGGPASGPHLMARLPEADAETQMEILFGLGQIRVPAAVPSVLGLAEKAGAPERIRIKALETLGQIAAPASIPGLLELLRRKGRIFTSAEPTEVRIAAARALLAIGTPAAEQGLRKILADEPRNRDRDALQRILDLHKA